MPYVNIKITREDQTTKQQKLALIRGVTDLLQDVLQKSPSSTHVIIDEIETSNWGLGGTSVELLRAPGETAK